MYGRFPLLSPLDFDPANDMRFLLIAVLGLTLGACNIVFKLPTRQGNVLDQKQLDQLKVGMSREQVIYLMGTPLAASPSRTDRWDYVGYYKSPRGKESSRTVTLYFENNALTKMEGVAAANAQPEPEGSSEAAAIYKQQKKEKNENERADAPSESGIVISPQPGHSP